MKPVRVHLEDDDLARLQEWAAKRGWTTSRAVRAAIRTLTTPEDDPVLELSGMVHGLPRNLSAQLDRYLDDVALTPSKHTRT